MYAPPRHFPQLVTLIELLSHVCKVLTNVNWCSQDSVAAHYQTLNVPSISPRCDLFFQYKLIRIYYTPPPCHLLYKSLTLINSCRKSGQNKLIRIMYHNGMYGFSQPLNFNSVPKLIEYFKQHSLSQYNNSLDITITHPLPRPKVL